MTDITQVVIDPFTQHDPGGKVRIKTKAMGDATFSDCMRFRYTLERWVNGCVRGLEDYALWIGMNPSTADADVDDPTVLREWWRTVFQLGCKRMVKMNLSPYRCTDPKDLLVAPFSAQHAENETLMGILAARAKVVVMAHGNPSVALVPILARLRRPLSVVPASDFLCLGTTQAGWARHPLYVARDELPRPYQMPETTSPRVGEGPRRRKRVPVSPGQ